MSKQIAKSANEDVLSNKALTAAHVGISIFDPAANKYLYNYQGDKYFVPASNTILCLLQWGDFSIDRMLEERVVLLG